MKMQFRNRQRQKVSRRMVLVLFGSILAIATITTTVIITTMDNRSSRARDVVTRPIHMVNDMAPVNDFTLPAPVLDATMPDADQAVFIRAVKTTDHSSNQQN